jgi:hypothetical protein
LGVKTNILSCVNLKKIFEREWNGRSSKTASPVGVGEEENSATCVLIGWFYRH